MLQFDVMGNSYEESLFAFPQTRKLEAQAIINRAKVSRGMALLDFAAGSGFLTLPLAQIIGNNGYVVAVDVSEVMLAHLRRKALDGNLSHIHCMRTDDPNLGDLEDDTFDRIVSLGGFHHVADQVQVTRSLYRTLKPSGIAVLMDFADGTPAQKHFDTLVHENNLTGHMALFMSESRARNLACYVGCHSYSVEMATFGWHFKDVDSMGRFFQLHHGLRLSAADTRDRILSNFRPQIRLDESLDILMDYVLLVLTKPKNSSTGE